MNERILLSQEKRMGFFLLLRDRRGMKMISTQFFSSRWKVQSVHRRLRLTQNKITLRDRFIDIATLPVDGARDSTMFSPVSFLSLMVLRKLYCCCGLFQLALSF